MRSASKLKSAYTLRGIAAPLLACLCLLGAVAAPACAAVAGAGKGGAKTEKTHEGESGGSLETVAKKASGLGRNVAMSLIGLALAVAAIVLAFRRDFKEAAAVLAVGLVCVLLAQEAGVNLLESTVKALTG